MALEKENSCASQFCLPPTKQMEEFSKAYVHAIASVAGYGVEYPPIDLDSVDLRIRQYGNQKTFPFKEGLSVQAKCTYAHKPKNGHFPFPLPIKNYNELRHKTCEPRILIVVHIPDHVESWLNQTDQFIALHYCGYWMSLLGLPETTNKNTVTVQIPTNQKFTVDELKRMMGILSKEEKPVF